MTPYQEKNKQSFKCSCCSITIFTLFWFVYLFNTDQNAVIPSSILISTDDHILSRYNLSSLFTQYLDPLCSPIDGSNALNQSVTNYPPDCMHLLESMINISQSQRFSFDEAQLLAQRLAYLSIPKDFSLPVLYIHIPKTGGTGFGEWLQSEVKRTVHIWIPSSLDPNMFDRDHFPNAHRTDHDHQRRRRRGRRMTRRLRRDRIIPRKAPKIHAQKIKFDFKNPKLLPFPQILYGHLAYGFDTVFLTPNEINKLVHHQITWKPRVNFTYITILRNPLTRVPSHYYYQKQRVEDPNHKWTEWRELDEWIGWFEESKDCMVQFVSGCHHLAWYSKRYKKIFDRKLNPWPMRQRDVAPDIFDSWRVTVEQYKVARRHLMEMQWIGLTEYMTESVEQFKMFWNVESADGVRRENVNEEKPKESLLEGTLDRIKKYNHFDLALWDLGYVLFLQQKLVVRYFKEKIQRIEIDAKNDHAILFDH